jgi:flagellar biosynthetic protein FliR
MESTITTTWALTLSAVLVRLAGLFAVGPVLSHAAVPRRLRCFIAIVVALGVMGRVTVPAVLPEGLAGLLGGLGGELLIGVAIGWAAGVVFVGVELGASHIAYQMGISLGEVFNPISPGAPGCLRQFFRLLAVVVFLGVGGHRAMLGAVLDMFRAVPLMSFSPSPAVARTMVLLVAVSFAMGLKVAAAVLVALLLASVAMGLLQRSLSQFHILSVGLPVRAMLALVVLAASLSALTGLVDAGMTMVLEQVGVAIRAGQ